MVESPDQLAQREREETARLVERRDIKRRRLHTLDTQADFYGDRDVPPHIEMERVQLRYEVQLLEQALNNPARTVIGDELGPAARFMVGLEQSRKHDEKLSLIGKRLDDFIDDSKAWRAMNRRWLIIIGVAVAIIVVAILIAVAVAVGFSLARGGL